MDAQRRREVVAVACEEGLLTRSHVATGSRGRRSLCSACPLSPPGDAIPGCCAVISSESLINERQRCLAQCLTFQATVVLASLRFICLLLSVIVCNVG